MKAYAVIGANFGDEGKGLITDFLAHELGCDTLVVRFNGGAQAGHTVVSREGLRHVFSHFGAGTFAGCASYLSKYFVANPIIFARELAALQRLALTPSIFIDPEAPLTTPIDMFINRTVEAARGDSKHGSCGLGINETVTRGLRDASMRTTVADVLTPAALQRKLNLLLKEWLPQRLTDLRIDRACEEVRSFSAKFDTITNAFLDDCAMMTEHATITANPARPASIIFEGAQGLRLDEDRIDQWPHLTRSKTGLFNVVPLSSRFGVDALNVIYITRTYLTRHGAGPLPAECAWRFADATNTPNAYQGSLRYAPLDLPQLEYSITTDLNYARRLLPAINASLAVTCADQLEPPHELFKLPLSVSYLSHGPSRRHVESGISRAGTPLLV